MLHAGDRISRIAQLLGVSPVTVRSQVKSVLRKLEVKSQLGAVAALDDLLALGVWTSHPSVSDDDPSPNCGMSGSPAVMARSPAGRIRAMDALRLPDGPWRCSVSARTPTTSRCGTGGRRSGWRSDRPIS